MHRGDDEEQYYRGYYARIEQEYWHEQEKKYWEDRVQEGKNFQAQLREWEARRKSKEFDDRLREVVLDEEEYDRGS